LYDLHGIFAPTKVQGMSAHIVKPPQFEAVSGDFAIGAPAAVTPRVVLGKYWIGTRQGGDHQDEDHSRTASPLWPIGKVHAFRQMARGLGKSTH